MTTSPRPCRTVETREYNAFARRMIRAYGRRVADGDIDALADLQSLRDEIDAALVTAVEGLTSDKWKFSWTAIGDALGIKRQAAQKRFGQGHGVKSARTVGGQPSGLR
jgi:hypothetical protein